MKALLGLAVILRPGLISANAGNDAGGIITYASAGSQFGYRTLFLMVLVTIALVVVQEMCSRLGAYSGEGLGALIREQFPLRSAALAMVLLFIANAGLTLSEFAGVGGAMEIFGVSRYIAIPLALGGIWAVTVLGSYSRAERVFRSSHHCHRRRDWRHRTPQFDRSVGCRTTSRRRRRGVPVVCVWPTRRVAAGGYGRPTFDRVRDRRDRRSGAVAVPEAARGAVLSSGPTRSSS